MYYATCFMREVTEFRKFYEPKTNTWVTVDFSNRTHLTLHCDTEEAAQELYDFLVQWEKKHFNKENA